MMHSLRLEGESDGELRERCERAAKYGKLLVDGSRLDEQGDAS